MRLGAYVNSGKTSPANASVYQIQHPILPPFEALAPYLTRIDQRRWYSNRGPLVWELEERLRNHLGLESQAVTLLASGSAALETAILTHAARAGDDRPLALMPSFTFAGSAQSALRCGYRPYFLDIDPETWMLDPAALAGHPALDRAGLILPVAAFGRRLDMRAWEAVHNRTGVPVVVDAAAAFEQFERAPELVSETVPAVLSMHATKIFSTAEGGAILLRSPADQLRSTQVSNFGMTNARDCLFDGLNGKLSEYHAAVGLAQLDGWPARQQAVADLTAHYRLAADRLGLSGRLHLPPDVSGAYVVYEAPDDAHAERLVAQLAAARVGHRRWYGRGLHEELVFAACERDAMTVTSDISARHLSLPAALDLTSDDVDYILGVVGRA